MEALENEKTTESEWLYDFKEGLLVPFRAVQRNEDATRGDWPHLDIF